MAKTPKHACNTSWHPRPGPHPHETWLQRLLNANHHKREVSSLVLNFISAFPNGQLVALGGSTKDFGRGAAPAWGKKTIEVMNKLAGIVLIAIVFSACKNVRREKTGSTAKTDFTHVIKSNYELTKPTSNLKKVLILFGGFAEKPADIEREFNILQIAKENNMAVIYMNYSQKLWLEPNDKQQLAEQLQKILLENKLPTDAIYLGGFSSGGNIALLIGAFLIENTNFNLTPKGVFIIDSPIDLVALYRSSEKNLARKFSEVSVQESTWIIETLGKRFGKPDNHIQKYQDCAVYTLQTNNFDNLRNLKNTKIRFYAEPDTLWWKENRKADYDQMNAFYIKRLYETLQSAGFNQVTYIPTVNKGYRANGDRHPHSWSIVDKKGLMQWITE